MIETSKNGGVKAVNSVKLFISLVLLIVFSFI